jgi:photosystem II protein
MCAYIEFSKGIPESKLPIIKLTKSKNGKTGTASFLFISPDILILNNSAFQDIDRMTLAYNNSNKKIITNDVVLLFREGKPFLLKAVFIFKNSQEWFNFLNFMTCYSKENGLCFSESN